MAGQPHGQAGVTGGGRLKLAGQRTSTSCFSFSLRATSACALFIAASTAAIVLVGTTSYPELASATRNPSKRRIG